MKKILYLLLFVFSSALGQLQLPYAYKNINVIPHAVDYYYYNSSTTPYTTTAQVISQVTSGLRYIGQTFNVAGVEFWFKDGILDVNLIAKGGVSNINSLGGVVITSPTTVQVLKFNGTNWVNVALLQSDIPLTNKRIAFGSTGNTLSESIDLTWDNTTKTLELSDAFKIKWGAFNTSIGKNVLINNTTGVYNIGIGQSSLNANTSGGGNIGLGNEAILSNTTGSGNVGIGHSSLQFNISGQNNAGLGNSSLKNNTTGSTNTGVGANSLENNTIGGINTGIGYYSLNAAVTSTYNVGIGGYSLASATGNSNIGLGAYANTSTNAASNEFVIGSKIAPIYNVYFGSGGSAVATHSQSNLNFYLTPSSGVDQAGGSHIINGGQSTGTGVGGSVILTTSPSGATGATVNTPIQRVVVDQLGNTTLNGQKELRFNNSGNTFYTSLKTGANTANLNLTLPIADGTAGQVLSTNGAGVLGFTTVSGGGAVSSVFSRTGAIVATEGDYTSNQLSDFLISSAATGQLLRFNGTNFVNTLLVAGDVPNLDWSKITTGKPTTLAGYGITDGALDANVVHKTGNEVINDTKEFTGVIQQGLSSRAAQFGWLQNLLYTPNTNIYTTFGNRYIVNHANSYDITGEVFGVKSIVGASGTNNMTTVNLFSAELDLLSATNTVTNFSGFYLKSATGSGAITGIAAGIYLENINKGGQKYAIYSNLGRVSFGDTLQLRNLAGTGDRVLEADQNGNLKATGRRNKTLAVYTTSLNYTGGTETDYYSYSIPANTMTTNGDAVTYEYSFAMQVGNVSYDMTGRIYFGGTEVIKIVDNNTAVVDEYRVLKATIIRTGTTTAKAVLGYINKSSSAVITFTTLLTGLDFTSTIIFKSTAAETDPSFPDFNAFTARVTFEPAP